MDTYNEGLHALLSLISHHANEHDRTTQDAMVDLQVLLNGYEDDADALQGDGPVVV